MIEHCNSKEEIIRLLWSLSYDEISNLGSEIQVWGLLNMPTIVSTANPTRMKYDCAHTFASNFMFYRRYKAQQTKLHAPVQEVNNPEDTSTSEQKPDVQKVKSKATPARKTATRRKPPFDSSRQLSIDFEDDDKQPVVNVQASTAETTSKPYRKPRIKRDFSRQLLISFDTEILGGKKDNGAAA